MNRQVRVFFFVSQWLLSLCAVSANAQNSDSATQQILPDARTLYSVDPNLSKSVLQSNPINIDVVWCRGDDAFESRRIVASEIASSLATSVRIGAGLISKGERPDVYVSSVRVRSLDYTSDTKTDSLINTTGAYINHKNVANVSFAQAMIDVTGRRMSIKDDQSLLPGTFRVFVCEDLDLSKIPPRIFINISRPDQTLFAQSLREKLRSYLPKIIVGRSTAVLSDLPDESQIRFFSQQDAAFAKNVAAIFSESSETQADVKFVSDLEERSRLGTVEIWIGKSYRVSRRSYLICIGENGKSCPPDSKHLECYTPVEQWARSQANCKKFEQRRVASIPGKRCGYEVVEITCVED